MANLFKQPFVVGTVFLHLLVHFLALREIPCHLTGQFDIDVGRTTASFADNGIENLNCL